MSGISSEQITLYITAVRGNSPTLSLLIELEPVSKVWTPHPTMRWLIGPDNFSAFIYHKVFCVFETLLVNGLFCSIFPSLISFTSFQGRSIKWQYHYLCPIFYYCTWRFHLYSSLWDKETKDWNQVSILLVLAGFNRYPEKKKLAHLFILSDM